MARWTVSSGDQELTIETTDDGRIAIGGFVADLEAAEDLRRYVGSAIRAVHESGASSCSAPNGKTDQP